MAAKVTWIAAGQSGATIIFISLPSGQLAFQSCKLANDWPISKLDL